MLAFSNIFSAQHLITPEYGLSAVKIKFLFALFLLMTGIQTVSAEVDYESGIYISTHADIAGINNQSSIFALPLERTYNSSALHTRMFGQGWGTIYETVLTVSDTGIIIIQDGGSGKKSFYALPQKIQKTHKKTHTTLLNNHSFSNNYRSRGAIDSATAQQETKQEKTYQWRLGCAVGVVQKESDGYKRMLAERTDFFDSKGRLYKATNKNGTIITIHRNEKDQISHINDNKGHCLTLDYSSDGFVIHAKRGHKEISYGYQGKTLVQVDRKDDTLNYTYNDENLLVKTLAHQEAIVTVTYDSDGRVSSVQLPNGTLRTYRYLDKTSPLVENGYTHGLLNTEFLDNQKIWQRTVLYARENNQYGLNHVSRILKKNDLGQTETRYQECGLPVSYIAGEFRTQSHYNDDCRLIMQNNGKVIKRLSYDTEHQKISEVTITNRHSSNATWSRFTYDEKGNLIHGKTSEALEAHLTYDLNSRIASMTDQKGQVLSFEYNDAGQPTLIAMTGGGKLVISYDEEGEIKKINVADGKGHEVSEKLLDTMQNLLRIIKPAGVDINI